VSGNSGKVLEVDKRVASGVIGDTVIESSKILFICDGVKIVEEVEVDVICRSAILKW
jgi:hypothetical protein